jgi:hypothetical protein
MVVQGIGERIAQARAADVEPVAAALEEMSDAARGRMLLMQNEQDRCGHE